MTAINFWQGLHSLPQNPLFLGRACEGIGNLKCCAVVESQCLLQLIFFSTLLTEVKTMVAYSALSDGVAVRYSATLVGSGEVSDANEVSNNSMDSATEGFLDAKDDRSRSIFSTETGIE